MWQTIKGLSLVVIFGLALVEKPGGIIAPIFFSLSFIYLFIFGIPKKAKILNKSDVLSKVIRNFGFAIFILVIYGVGEINSYNFYANSDIEEGVVVKKFEKICSYKRKRRSPTVKYPCWDVEIKIESKIIQESSFKRDEYKVGQKVFVLYAKDNKNDFLNLRGFFKSYDEKPEYKIFKDQRETLKTYFEEFDKLYFLKFMIFIFSLILYGIRWSYIYKANKFNEPPNYKDTDLLKDEPSEKKAEGRVEPHF